MKVIVSSNAPKGRIVYHYSGCMYEKRIKESNKKSIKLGTAKYSGYCACRYCSGLGGHIRVYRKLIDKSTKKHGHRYKYDKNNDSLYIATDVGGWKIEADMNGKFCLFHMNQFKENMSFDEFPSARYHIQSDVKKSESVESFLDYITRHDIAKKIIADDYRKLPKSNKKEKMYYYKAKAQKKRKERRRVNSIFRKLEKKDPELKQYSIN